MPKKSFIFYFRVSQKSVRQQSAPTVPVVPSGAIFPVNPLTSQFAVVSSMASPSSQHPLGKYRNGLNRSIHQYLITLISWKLFTCIGFYTHNLL